MWEQLKSLRNQEVREKKTWDVKYYSKENRKNGYAKILQKQADTRLNKCFSFESN